MIDMFAGHPRRDSTPGDRAAKVRQTFLRRFQARFFLRFPMLLVFIATVLAPAVTLMSDCGEDRK